MFAYTEAPFAFYTVLLFSLLYGFLAGLVYEMFRIVRFSFGYILPRRVAAVRWLMRVALFFADLMFFFLIGIAAVLFLFVFNRGQLRLSMLVLMTAGFGMYYVTLGRILCCLYKTIVQLMFRIAKKIYFHTVRYVFIFIFFIWKMTMGKVIGKFKLGIEHLTFRLTVACYERRLDLWQKSAENGLLDREDHILMN